jgi:hypothetical protein
MISRLESLPAELLQPILLLSGNVSLPLSSHVIGAKLSNEQAYEALSMLHLFPIESDVQADQQPKRNRSVASPQHVLLSAKFMTWSRFRRYFGAFFTRVINPGVPLHRREGTCCFVEAFFFFSRTYSEPLLCNAVGPPTLHIIRVDVTSSLWFKRGLFDKLVSVFSNMVLPLKLLQLPIQADNAQFLHFLLRCDVAIPTARRKLFRKTTDAMFDAAALHPDPTMLACLFSEQLGFRLTPHTIRRAIVDLNAPLSSLDILHAAHVPCVRNALKSFISMPHVKATIRWVEDGKRNKDPKARAVEARFGSYLARKDEKASWACVTVCATYTDSMIWVGRKQLERRIFMKWVWDSSRWLYYRQSCFQ